jgi:hypothetical protein
MLLRGALIGICDTPLVSHQDSECSIPPVFEFAVGTALAADEELRLTPPTPFTNSQSDGVTVGWPMAMVACRDACGGGDRGRGTNGVMGAAGAVGGATSYTDETPTLSETTVTTGAVVWDGAVIVRCAFFDRNFHSRMPLVPTPAPLEALACV